MHFLDRYIGIPVIAVLGCLRRKRKLPSKIDSIGLLRTAAIGDTVLMSAAVADLRKAFPQASLTFFAGPSNFEIAQMLDGLDRVVKIPIGDVIQGIRAVRSVSVDVMLDFGQWPRLEALLAAISRASFTIGFRTPAQHRHFAYDRNVSHSSKVHEIDNFRELVRVVGAGSSHAPSLRCPQPRTALTHDYAVFHLWPGGRRKDLKRWPVERWLQLIEQFARWEIEVVLTGAPCDRYSNDEVISQISSAGRRFVSNAAGLSLSDTAAVLGHSRLVVSVDTGVMHMAAALNVPLVALHGPTSSKRWGPLSDRAAVVQAPLAQCGYISLGWERVRPVPACMDCIRYEDVRETCQGLLQKGRANSREQEDLSQEPVEK